MKIRLSYTINNDTFDEDIECDDATKLIQLAQLFKDIDINCTSDRVKLALAILRNRLDSSPLCMLIDELQTTEEYVQQSKHHPKYQDMWNLLIEIGKQLTRTHMYLEDKRSLRLLIGRLLAPCKKCEGTGYIRENNRPVEPVYVCPECQDGYAKDLFTGSTHKPE